MPQNVVRGRKASQPARLSARAVFAAAIAVAAMGITTPAARAGDDTDSIYDKFLEVIGVKSPGQDINYGERSPLVVPPNRDLPPPAAAAAPAVPDWPRDPDLTGTRRAKVKEERVRPTPDYAVELAQPLRPSQLNIPGPAPGAARTGGTNPVSGADYPEQAGRSKRTIFSFDWFKKREYATFTGEPPRGSLTDPPPGYLTPSPDQPYGAGQEHKVYKPPTVADRVTPVTGSGSGN
jgi:hypothetical protein